MEGAAQPAAPRLFCCGIIRSFHDLAQTAPADAVFAPGKPDLPRFADQIGQWDRAELPRIRARVSIVAEHENLAGRHREIDFGTNGSLAPLNTPASPIG